jgi:uncharacterized membrane protein
MNALNNTILPLARDLRANSMVETAFVMPVLVLLLLGVFDFGRAYYYGVEVSSAAHAAAVYGIHNVSDTAGMTTAAQLDAPDIPSLTVSPSYGCECFDGSAKSSSCTAPPATCAEGATTENYVNYVQVTASATYTPILVYPGLPKTFTLTGSAYMRAGGD